jgi:hypothetical protein
MKTTPPIGLVARVIAGVVIAAAFAVPASSASALTIDCSYTPGMSGFVDRLNDPGVRCARTGESSGSTPGGGQLGRPGSSLGGAASTSVTSCKYPTPSMPDWFYSNGPIFATDLPALHYPDPSGADDVFADYRTEYRDGHGNRIGTRDYIVSTKRSLTVPARMYLSDFNSVHFPVEVVQMWRCDQPTWGPELFNNMSPTTGDIDPIATPDDDPVPFRTSVVTARSSLGPVPFRPNEYFYRVDVTNNTAAGSSLPAVLSIDLDEFEINEVIALPAAGSCPAYTPATQTCTVSQLLPGQTQTFTFRVTAKKGFETAGVLTAKADTFVNAGRATGLRSSWTSVAVH